MMSSFAGWPVDLWLSYLGRGAGQEAGKPARPTDKDEPMQAWLPLTVLIVLLLGVLILFDLRAADPDDAADEEAEDDEAGLESSWDAFFREQDEHRRRP